MNNTIVSRLATSAARATVAVAALAASLAPPLAQAQSCKWQALQQTPCALVPAEVVAKSLGVAAASLQVEDNVKIMAKMPQLTTCIFNMADGAEVRIGQIAASSPQAFDSRYRSQSDAEIAAGMGAGTRQAEAVVGRNLGSAEKANAQGVAAEMVRGLQFQPVAGLGDKASVMYSGSSPNAHLITLVKDHTFVVQVRASKASREKNLELAKPIATAVVARCR